METIFASFLEQLCESCPERYDDIGWVHDYPKTMVSISHCYNVEYNFLDRVVSYCSITYVLGCKHWDCFYRNKLHDHSRMVRHPHSVRYRQHGQELIQRNQSIGALFLQKKIICSMFCFENIFNFKIVNKKHSTRSDCF